VSRSSTGLQQPPGVWMGSSAPAAERRRRVDGSYVTAETSDHLSEHVQAWGVSLPFQHVTSVYERWSRRATYGPTTAIARKGPGRSQS
jgi:hypothetical protein